ncbi:hypothetical protein [Catenibacterium sp.]|uniref:hypothetical protein n=1 Tax=Catenibacterium sp. TaxID=2049022 RepID=UPI003993B043
MEIMAEFVEKYLEKGIKIALSGRVSGISSINVRTDLALHPHYTEVIMDDVEFGKKPKQKRRI